MLGTNVEINMEGNSENSEKLKAAYWVEGTIDDHTS